MSRLKKYLIEEFKKKGGKWAGEKWSIRNELYYDFSHHKKPSNVYPIGWTLSIENGIPYEKEEVEDYMNSIKNDLKKNNIKEFVVRMDWRLIETWNKLLKKYLPQYKYIDDVNMNLRNWKEEMTFSGSEYPATEKNWPLYRKK